MTYDFSIAIPEEFLFRLGLAALCGAVLGVERKVRNKSTGMKTHFLICVGSMLFAHLGIEIASLLVGDKTRVLSNIVTGVGFIGAGSIIKDNDRVVGLTTAALVWVSAAIGAAIGAGFYIEAVSLLVIVVATIPVLAWVERKLPDHE